MTAVPQTRVGLVAVLGLILLAGTALYMRQSVERLHAAVRLQALSHEVNAHLEELLARLTNAESAVQRYVITGQEAFLEPGAAERRRIDEVLARLRDLVADPAQRGRLVRLEPLVRARLLSIDRLVRTRRDHGYAPAAAQIATGPGNALSNDLRAAVGEMAEEQTRLLEERARLAARRRLHTLYTVPAGTAVSAGLLAVAFVMLRRQARAAEEAREELRTLVEGTPDAMVIVDAEGRIVRVNEQAERMFGYPRADLLDRPVEVLMPERFRAAHGGLRSGYVRDPRTRPMGRGMALLGERRDGTEFPIEISLAPLRAGERLMVTAAVRDVTDRVRAEATLNRLHREVAANADRLEAANRELETFAYSVSHDLRAPLRAMSGFGQALLEDCGDRLDDRGQGHLGRILAAAERMGRLIDDLLALSRTSRAELRSTTVDLSALAREVLADLRQREPDRTVDCAVQDGLVVRGDEALLLVALTNLLGNAWKFTSRRPEARIEFGAAEEKDGRVFRVRDNGAGFDMAYADKLFGVFTRLHAEQDYPGTGIGLATVQRIIARHGGKVWAEGKIGGGATFFFTLAEAAPPGGPEDTPAARL